MQAKRTDRPWIPGPDDLPDERDLELLPQLGDLAENPLYRRLVRSFPRRLGAFHRFRLAALIATLFGSVALFVLAELPPDWIARIFVVFLALATGASSLVFPLPGLMVAQENHRDRVAKLADPLLSLGALDGTHAAAAMIARYRSRAMVARGWRLAGYSMAASAGILYFWSLLASLQRIPVTATLLPVLWLGYLGYEFGLGRGALPAATRMLASVRLKGWFNPNPLPDAIAIQTQLGPFLLASLAFWMEMESGGARNLNLHLRIHPPTFLAIGGGVAILGACLGRVRFHFARRRAARDFEILAWRLELLIFPRDPDPARRVPVSVRRWKRQVKATYVLLGTIVVAVLGGLGWGVRFTSHYAGALRGGMTKGPNGHSIVATGRLDSHQRYFLRRGDVAELEVRLSSPADFDPLREELLRSGRRKLDDLRIDGLHPGRFADALFPEVASMILLFESGSLDASALLDPTVAPDLERLMLLGDASLSDPGPLIRSTRPPDLVLGLSGLPDPNLCLAVPRASLVFFNAPGLDKVRMGDSSKVGRIGFVECPDLRSLAIERGPDTLRASRSPLLEEIELGGVGLRDLSIANNRVLRRIRILQAADLESLVLENCPTLEVLELGAAPKLTSVFLGRCDSLDLGGVEFGAADVSVDSAVARAIEGLLFPPEPTPAQPVAVP